MPKPKTSVSAKAMPIIMFTLFLDVLGVGILVPVLPQLIFSIFMPAGFSRNESLILLGWLTGIFPFMQFLATPILGQLSDRFGRKPVLGFSLAGTALGYVLFAVGIITKNIPLLFFSRALDGVTGGNVSVARAVIADVTPPEKRTQNFALIGAAFGFGFVMGPYIGARLAAPNIDFFGLFTTPGWFSAATPFWFTAILSSINALLLVLILPETHQHINKALRLTWNKSLDNIRRAATAPGLRVIFGAEFLFWSGFTFFTTFFQVFLIQKLGFQVNNVGDFFAWIGIWMAVVQALVVPIAAKFLKNYQVLRISMVGLALALFVQLWPHNTAQLLVVSPLVALFVGMTMANVAALVSLSAGDEMQGEILGIEASVQALAQSIPAVVSGYVATMGVNMPVIVGGLIVLAGWLLYMLFYHPSRHLLHESVAQAAAEARATGH